MISALEADELNKNTLLLMEFFDGAPLFKENFDRLPSYISQSYIYVAEMICLWEASFPASENYFQLHQIMDRVWQHGTAQPKKSAELVKEPMKIKKHMN